jgi:hypothetical protein
MNDHIKRWFKINHRRNIFVRASGRKRIEGTKVFDQRGRAIGTVNSLIMDRHGTVLFAAVACWARLHTRRTLRHVRWTDLSYDGTLCGFRADIAGELPEDASHTDGHDAAQPDHTRETYERWADPPHWGM